MIKTLRLWLAALVLVGSIGGSAMVLATASTTYAAGPPANCPNTVLTFPTWYRGLQDGDCNIKPPGSGNSGLSNFIWKIVLNIIEIALQLVGYLAVGFIIYGGFKYITGAGAPDKIVAGRKIILNAVVGLIISIFSIAIVNLINRGF
ncbi:MAG: hypothetical protein JWM00_127 [Candidatus Saccharibacteria bacterium]|nr:hypothetical protein [Candidatus Saccharibacteria bacterium]